MRLAVSRPAMSRAIPFAFVSLLALLGCDYDAVGACESSCERGIANGCFPEATTDCVADCEDAEAEYDQARANAGVAMCQGEFDSLTGCLDSADPCSASECGTERTSLFECAAEFCASAPTSPVCRP